jgi:hypothetical protein
MQATPAGSWGRAVDRLEAKLERYGFDCLRVSGRQRPRLPKPELAPSQPAHAESQPRTSSRVLRMFA